MLVFASQFHQLVSTMWKAYFFSNGYTTTDVHLSIINVELRSLWINQNSSMLIFLQIYLNVGDYVQFEVGWGKNKNYISDKTAANITTTAYNKNEIRICFKYRKNQGIYSTAFIVGIKTMLLTFVQMVMKPDSAQVLDKVHNNEQLLLTVTVHHHKAKKVSPVVDTLVSKPFNMKRTMTFRSQGGRLSDDFQARKSFDEPIILHDNHTHNRQDEINIKLTNPKAKIQFNTHAHS